MSSQEQLQALKGLHILVEGVDPRWHTHRGDLPLFPGALQLVVAFSKGLRCCRQVQALKVMHNQQTQQSLGTPCMAHPAWHTTCVHQWSPALTSPAAAAIQSELLCAVPKWTSRVQSLEVGLCMWCCRRVSRYGGHCKPYTLTTPNSLTGPGSSACPSKPATRYTLPSIACMRPSCIAHRPCFHAQAATMITVKPFMYTSLPGPPCGICCDVSILLSVKGGLVTVAVSTKSICFRGSRNAFCSQCIAINLLV